MTRIDPFDTEAVDRKIRELSAQEGPPLLAAMAPGTRFIAVAYEGGQRWHLEYEYLGDGLVETTTSHRTMPAALIDQRTIRGVRP